MKCCIDHLVRTGRGFRSGPAKIYINTNHCIDGEKARCSTCRRTWEHICDEAEGCQWVCVSTPKKHRGPEVKS